MLTGIHLLLTYKCTAECDHCFVYSSPRAEGTMTLDQIDRVLAEAEKIGTVRWIYFEGGEPFLFYATLLEGVRRARNRGFEVGIVTNAYWATSEADAVASLRPLADLGLADLSVSDDDFHHGGRDDPPRRAVAVARTLGIPVGTIAIEEATVEPGSEGEPKGQPVVGGGVMFRGRAVDSLVAGLPHRNEAAFDQCPHEDFEDPSRVHVDAFGTVQLCQGVSLGNMNERPLSEIIASYTPATNPICAALHAGGPARGARSSRSVGRRRRPAAAVFAAGARRASAGASAAPGRPRPRHRAARRRVLRARRVARVRLQQRRGLLQRAPRLLAVVDRAPHASRPASCAAAGARRGAPHRPNRVRGGFDGRADRHPRHRSGVARLRSPSDADPPSRRGPRRPRGGGLRRRGLAPRPGPAR
jgi:hypothetical protein